MTSDEIQSKLDKIPKFRKYLEQHSGTNCDQLLGFYQIYDSLLVESLRGLPWVNNLLGNNINSADFAKVISCIQAARLDQTGLGAHVRQRGFGVFCGTLPKRFCSWFGNNANFSRIPSQRNLQSVSIASSYGKSDTKTKTFSLQWARYDNHLPFKRTQRFRCNQMQFLFEESQIKSQWKWWIINFFCRRIKCRHFQQAFISRCIYAQMASTMYKCFIGMMLRNICYRLKSQIVAQNVHWVGFTSCMQMFYLVKKTRMHHSVNYKRNKNVFQRTNRTCVSLNLIHNDYKLYSSNNCVRPKINGGV